MINAVMTNYGPIKFLSFNEFLGLLNVKHVTDDIFRYDTLVDMPSTSFSGYYEQRSAYLISFDDDVSKKNILTSHLIDIVKEICVFKKSTNALLSFFNVLVDDHLFRFGMAEYAVRIAPNRWVPVNLEDYEIVFNSLNKSIGLACYAEYRAVMFTRCLQSFDLFDKMEF